MITRGWLRAGIPILVLLANPFNAARADGPGLQRGIDALHAGNAKLAIKLLTTELETPPRSSVDLARALYFRAKAHLADRQTARAMADANAALWLRKLSPSEIADAENIKAQVLKAAGVPNTSPTIASTAAAPVNPTPSAPEPIRQRRAVADGRVEHRHQLALLEAEVALHDRVDTLEVPQHHRTAGTFPDHPFELGQQRPDHRVVLLQPVDDLAKTRVLAPQPGEERGVLVAVVRAQRGAHRVAAQHQVVAQGGRTSHRVEPVTGVVEHVPDPIVQASQLGAQRAGPVAGARRGRGPCSLPDRHPTTVGGPPHPGNP